MNLQQAIHTVWDFLQSGGIFMGLIGACALAAMAVIIYKFITLSRKRIAPYKLSIEIEHFESYLNSNTLGELEHEFHAGRTPLARLCGVAMENANHSTEAVKEAVQSSAREEIVKMNAGLPVLDVIITISPLLGLLGTASGLVTVFADLGDGALNNAIVAKGIALALSTTISGIAVAVPAVIAHSYFSRKIETLSARLEVLLGKVVSATHHTLSIQNTPPDHRA